MDSLKDKLQQLGLSGRESEVYLALLQKSDLSAPEIAKLTTITRTKSYEILQNLVKKGLCNEKFRDGIKIFRSIEPDIAIENLLSVYASELERVKNLAGQIKSELIKLHSESKGLSDPLDYIEVLNDRVQIRERLIKIQENTESELLVFTKPPYLLPLEENVKEAAKILGSRVIKVRSIYEYEGMTTAAEREELIKVIERFQQLGEEARIIKVLPMKMVICDNNISMLSLADRVTLKPASTTTMIIRHPSLAIALKNMFESYWRESMAIEQFKIMISEEKMKATAYN
jgi:sugar-specific transcriptional regulator TrmB